MEATPLTPLDLTHVLYDGTSHMAQVAAVITLSPILLMPVYVGIIVKTRELTVVNMVLGQLLSDLFNHFLKHWIRQERPSGLLGDGYGFPSSHSQYMGYFATFLILHLSYRHTFVSYGPSLRWLDYLQRAALYSCILLWSTGVAYTRYFLNYHTPMQVFSGFAIGTVFGAAYYFLSEPPPTLHSSTASPTTSRASLRRTIINSPFGQYWRVRDGWAVYADGGVETEWKAWRMRWDNHSKLE